MDSTQEKKNYMQECNGVLRSLKAANRKPKLLLHVCCAPCSSAVLLKLKEFFQISLFYYNPNIAPADEYRKREIELQKLVSFYKNDFNFNCEILSCEYNHEAFLHTVVGFENEPEGGARCQRCHQLRLKKTAEYATQNGFHYFCSTLSISPHKNALLINELGFSLETENCRWLPNDFKKENGYLLSCRLSKQYGLYRQDFCGCEFSQKKAD